MALPPERITVKRRRDEDPVEALYIQSKKQRPGVFWKLQSRPDGQLQSVQEPPTVGTRKDTANLTNNGTSSSILQPNPKNIELPAESRESRAGHGSSKSLHVDHGEKAVDDKFKSLQAATPRRYHLAHDFYHNLKRQPSFTSDSKIKKRQRPQRDHLAVFVESARGEKLVQRTLRERNGTTLDTIEGHESHVNAGGTIRKRPNVNAAERAWRSETWGKQNTATGMVMCEKKNQPATSWDTDSMQVAQELQQFALDQSRAASQLSPTTALKFRPKPPGPRRTTDIAAAEGDIPIAVTQSNLDEDGDYIIDIYIQAQFQTHEADRFRIGLNPLDSIETGKVGILVIDDDQEKLWEDFGDEEQSEVEFESDEEDENAEDYYGNDYPEDEVDTDDEYGRGSYNHRTRASDDEEYDGDEPEWSDVEDRSDH